MDMQSSEAASSRSVRKRLGEHGHRVSGWLGRLAIVSALLTVVCIAFAVPHAAAAVSANGLRLSGSTAKPEYTLGDPVSVRWDVTNLGSDQCELSSLSDGTVTITHVTLNGVEIRPRIQPIDYVENLGLAIAVHLETIKQGQQAQIITRSLTSHVDPSPGEVIQGLESVSWSPMSQDIAEMWPIASAGDYRVTAEYSMPPVSRTSCQGYSNVATVQFTIVAPTHSNRNLIIILITSSIGVLAILALLFWRRHRTGLRRSAIRNSAWPLAIVLVLSVGALIAHPEKASADSPLPPMVFIDQSVPGFKDAVDSCVAKFNDYQSIWTENKPIWTDLSTARNKDGKPLYVYIELNPDPSRPDSSGPLIRNAGSNKEGSNAQINWAPHGHYELQPGLYSSPCLELFHEMIHALSSLRGTFDETYCGSTDLGTEEVKGSIAENGLRAYLQEKLRRLGKPPDPSLKQRTLYGYPGNYHKLPPNGLDACKGGRVKSGNRARAAGEDECLTESCGSTNGDPHLTTFDGLYYDFQAAGEFIAAKSPSGSFEIQVRQEPFFGSTDISVNTAVAFNISGNRFGVYVGPSGITTRLNGSPRVLR